MGNRLIAVLATVGALASTSLALAALDYELPWYVLPIGIVGSAAWQGLPYLLVSHYAMQPKRSRRELHGLAFALVVYAFLDCWVQFFSYFRAQSSTDPIAGALMPLLALSIMAFAASLWWVGAKGFAALSSNSRH